MCAALSHKAHRKAWMQRQRVGMGVAPFAITPSNPVKEFFAPVSTVLSSRNAANRKNSWVLKLEDCPLAI